MDEWRDEIACYGVDVTGTPKEIITKLFREFQKTDWRWREEIAKHLPQIGVMSFVGARSTIKWLMDHVEIKPEHKELADKLKSIKESNLSEQEKRDAELQSLFPNLGPRLPN